jgi:hypothetical protein
VEELGTDKMQLTGGEKAENTIKDLGHQTSSEEEVFCFLKKRKKVD